MSRVGQAIINIPDGVEVKKNENGLKEIANSAQGDINKQGKQTDNIKM